MSPPQAAPGTSAVLPGAPEEVTSPPQAAPATASEDEAEYEEHQKLEPLFAQEKALEKALEKASERVEMLR